MRHGKIITEFTKVMRLAADMDCEEVTMTVENQYYVK